MEEGTLWFQNVKVPSFRQPMNTYLHNSPTEPIVFYFQVYTHTIILPAFLVTGKSHLVSSRHWSSNTYACTSSFPETDVSNRVKAEPRDIGNPSFEWNLTSGNYASLCNTSVFQLGAILATVKLCPWNRILKRPNQINITSTWCAVAIRLRALPSLATAMKNKQLWKMLQPVDLQIKEHSMSCWEKKKDEGEQQAEMLKFLSNNSLWASSHCNDMWKMKPDSHWKSISSRPTHHMA